MRRLRPLSETECYIRCYGGWEQTVRLVARERIPRRPAGSALAGDGIRCLFEEKLESRPPEAAPEAA
jgi:hypothetical protein